MIVAKWQRRLNDVDKIVLSLYAKGLTTGEFRRSAVPGQSRLGDLLPEGERSRCRGPRSVEKRGKPAVGHAGKSSQLPGLAGDVRSYAERHMR